MGDKLHHVVRGGCALSVCDQGLTASRSVCAPASAGGVRIWCMINRFAFAPVFVNLVIWGSLITGVLTGPSAHAQSSNEHRPIFEVASIRTAAIPETGGEGSSRSQIEYAADSLTMRNIDLSEMVQWAYNLEHYQLQGPNMLVGQRYDVRARAGGRVAVATLRLMLQDLLATRFNVQLHHEQKRTSVYELVVAKDGPRLPKDKSDTLPSSYP